MQQPPTGMRQTPTELTDGKATLAFIAILLLGTALRFFDLGAREVWLDEAFSWNQASMGFTDMLKSVARDVHPPLYQTVLWVNTRILGDSPFALRLPSAIFSCIAVAMTYQLTRRISSKPAALLAMGFAAISTFQLWYAQEARMYSLLAMLTLASMIMLVRLLTQASKRNTAGYILFSTLLLYTHVYGIFVLLAQHFFYLYLWAGKRSPGYLPLARWIRVHLLITLGYLPWLWILLLQITSVQDNFWITASGVNALLQTLKAYQSLPSLMFLATAALACAGFVKTFMNPDRSGQLASQHSSGALLIFWLCIPILVPFALSQVLQPIYVARYTIAAAFPWYILVAIGICSLPRFAAAALTVAILAFATANLSPYYKSRIAMAQWDEVSTFIEEHGSKGDYLIFHSDYGSLPYRYNGDTSKFRVITVDSGFDPALNGVKLNEVSMAIKPQGNIWLVESYAERLALPTQTLINLIEKTHYMEEERRFGIVRLLIFKPAE